MKATKTTEQLERLAAHKATQAVIEQRVTEVLRLRLAGATLEDIREYAATEDAATGRPWNLSTGQLKRYIARSDEAMTAAVEKRRDTLLARHLARRELLYAKCVEVGDFKGALAVLRDSAELQRLYEPPPPKPPEGAAANGTDTEFFVTVERLAVEVRRRISGPSIPGSAGGNVDRQEPVAEAISDRQAASLSELLRR